MSLKDLYWQICCIDAAVIILAVVMIGNIVCNVLGLRGLRKYVDMQRGYHVLQRHQTDRERCGYWIIGRQQHGDAAVPRETEEPAPMKEDPK